MGVDVLRGIAMLGVIAIHARPLEEWSWHASTIGRSVPVFLVLVGVSAQLWWSRQQSLGATGLGRAYLAATGRRLAVPYWTWLAAMLLIGAWNGRLPDSLGLWLLSPFGYAPWAGPTWFIAAIVLVSLIVPLLHFAMARIGPLALCVLGLFVTLYCHRHALAIMDAGRDLLPLPQGMKPFFFFWIFVPSYLWHLTSGMWLGRHRGKVGAAVWSLGALGLIWGLWGVRDGGLDKLSVNAARAFMDVPLTLLLLWLTHPLSRVPLIGQTLSFVGRNSWGMYLGHILIFGAFEGAGRLYQFMDPTTRWLYFAGLFVGGLSLTVVGRFVRTRLGRRFAWLASHPRSSIAASGTP